MEKKQEEMICWMKQKLEDRRGVVLEEYFSYSQLPDWIMSDVVLSLQTMANDVRGAGLST